MERCSVWNGISIKAGTLDDYEALAEFHYRGGRPGGVMRVWTAWFDENANPKTRNAKPTREELTSSRRGKSASGRGADESPIRRFAGSPIRAGVLVECLPALSCALRGVALGGRYAGMDRTLAAAQLNREVRTIARVVVHPMFRATGLAVELVKRALAEAQTPFVEALAAMGRVNRFFERAGMRAYERPMGADGVRLVAALQTDAATRGNGDAARGSGVSLLAGLRAEEVSDFLVRELKRFARKKDGGMEDWLEEARGRLFSWPVYFLWKNDRV